LHWCKGQCDELPDDTDALKAALIEARAKLSGARALIEHLQLVIAKMQREKFGPRSEHSQRLIDQLELQLEELATAAGEEEVKAETKSSARLPREKCRRTGSLGQCSAHRFCDGCGHAASGGIAGYGFGN
jgi:hypothetical protein